MAAGPHVSPTDAEPAAPPQKTPLSRACLAVAMLLLGLILLVFYACGTFGFWWAFSAGEGTADIEVTISQYGLGVTNNASAVAVYFRTALSILGTVAGACTAIGLMASFRRYSLLTALIVLLIVGVLGAMPFILVPPRKDDSAVTLALHCPKLPAKEVAAIQEALSGPGMEKIMGPEVLKALGCEKGLPIAGIETVATDVAGEWELRFICRFGEGAKGEQRDAIMGIFQEVLVSRTNEAMRRAGLRTSGGAFHMHGGSWDNSAWRRRAQELGIGTGTPPSIEEPAEEEDEGDADDVEK